LRTNQSVWKGRALLFL